LHDAGLDDGGLASETDFASRRMKLGLPDRERPFMRKDDRRAKRPDFTWLRLARIPAHRASL